MTNPYLKALLKYQRKFSPVVPFDPQHDRITALDFTDENRELSPSIINNIELFEAYIHQKLEAANALYGIGGYGEHRTIYSRSRLFDAGEIDEPRRLHLGTDIWGKAGTTVSAPMDSTVHSYADNAAPGDYGATIILRHELEGLAFFTLYGHLGHASLQGLEQGQSINAGRVFAAFGNHRENGYWPPHLHFQVIIDMQGRRGDYPGVCRFSEKETWLRNSPDADLILDLNRSIASS